MKHVLFVSEKFCDANPELGWTNSFHNLFATFRQYRSDYIFNTLHLDESSVVFQKHVDEVLVNYCEKWKPEIIFFTLLGGSSYNPSATVLQGLREKGIYLCFLWPDTGPGWPFQTINSLRDIANLHVSIDHPMSPWHDKQEKLDNHLHLWTPEDRTLFFRSDDKDIDVSFIGSDRYPDRAHFLNHLRANYPSIVIRGGQREEKLSPEDYALLIRRSKIHINFSLNPTGYFQLKGRVLETLASGSLLLEFKNPCTRKFFTPDTDYVEFEDENELVNKIRYYLENENERLKIADQGNKTFLNNWTSDKFWDLIIKRIESEKTV